MSPWDGPGHPVKSYQDFTLTAAAPSSGDFRGPLQPNAPGTLKSAGDQHGCSGGKRLFLRGCPIGYNEEPKRWVLQVRVIAGLAEGSPNPIQPCEEPI